LKAVVFTRYGPPGELVCRDLPRPQPGKGEVLVRVRAAAVNPKDCLVRKGKFRLFTGRRFPQGVGHDFAGEVAAVGSHVAGFAVGDAVFGMTNGWRGRAYAEYLVAPAAEMAPKPAALDYIQAAAVPLAAQTALQALRDLGRIADGAKACINGASGGVGTFAVQIARICGAEVTAICSARNADKVRALGASQVIDYTQGDILPRLPGCDIFFDVFGNRRFHDLKPYLAAKGAFISTVPNRRILIDRWMTPRPRGTRARLVIVRSRRADLDWLTRRIDEGRLHPVVDRVMDLETAGAAHTYVETRRARGKVVLQVA
jgi:NADPH:quinone reductase-like Zn-dependent oxidoreductase